MNIFSSDAFLTTLAEVYFPGRPFQIGLYRTLGRTFRLLSVDGRPPITRWDFFDSAEPVAGDAAEGPAQELGYLPLAILETSEITAVPESIADGPVYFPAPYLDWSRFSDWTAFAAHFASRRSSLLRDSRQKRRRLEQELGPIRFVYHDERPEVFERCIAWKSAQYVRSGLPDMFHHAANVQLFRSLADKGALVISSFSTGERLMAVHFGGLAGKRFYSWIAAYDPDQGRHSPGRLLLEDLLRASQSAGHSEFDFGIGASDYKWHYATHNRTVGPLGKPPATLTVRRAAKSSLRRLLAPFPALLAGARRIRNRLRERRLG
jgi:hypothetical protein